MPARFSSLNQPLNRGSGIEFRTLVIDGKNITYEEPADGQVLARYGVKYLGNSTDTLVKGVKTEHTLKIIETVHEYIVAYHDIIYDGGADKKFKKLGDLIMGNLKDSGVIYPAVAQLVLTNKDTLLQNQLSYPKSFESLEFDIVDAVDNPPAYVFPAEDNLPLEIQNALKPNSTPQEIALALGTTAASFCLLMPKKRKVQR